ncbi:unnamed protein product [Phaedon cochleariae]|uniref:Uncharacterized protein n=1 Tax=Phaedon cochleariae TaxID=80249 RepID=A0A9N9SA54_PHACE|nr:unnamed protein product [Phaedon cochleariae]
MSRNVRKGEEELLSAVKNVVGKLCSSEEFINNLAQIISETISEKFYKEIDALKEENKKNVEKISKQQSIIDSLIDKQERFDKQLRRNNIIFHGIQEKPNENCSQLVLDTILDKMKINYVGKDVIENTYRIGKYDKNKARPIMVKFTTASHKNMIFRNKKLMKNTGIILREDITPEQLKIFKAALLKVGKNGKIWTNLGVIFAKYNDEESIIKIHSMLDVDML